MKKILFDLLSAQPAKDSKFHGGGEYIKSIFRELAEKHNIEIELIVMYDSSRFIDEWILKSLKDKEIICMNILTYNELNQLLLSEKIDIFFTGLLANYMRVDFPSNTYTIGTIHGLRDIEQYIDKYAYLYNDNILYKVKNIIKIFIAKKQREKYRGYYEKILYKFDSVVCVSNFTLSSIKCNLNLVGKDIKVFYTPQKIIEKNRNCMEAECGNYILMIGGNRWIKNIYRGIVAIDKMIDRNLLDDSLKIVVIGNVSNTIKKRIKNIEKFIFKNYVSTEELEELYQNCNIFLYPTLNEGFGMPPLEAMNYGKTCIVSAVASLPEICGDAVYYINPYDIQEIMNKIYYALHYKIDEERIFAQVNRINERRKADLDLITNYIIHCTDNN